MYACTYYDLLIMYKCVKFCEINIHSFNDKNLTLFFAFVDLEKAFDRVPRKVLWWAMRMVGVEEWIVRLVQAMYNNARSRVRVGSEYSEEF